MSEQAGLPAGWVDEFFEALTQACSALSLRLGPDKLDLLAKHFEVLRTANRQFNLTGITDPVAAAVKLYGDSLAPLAWVEQGGVTLSQCLDIGSGGGFPAVPLAVARPGWRVTALEATGKKARFIASAAEQLSIGNVRSVHARAEAWQPPVLFEQVVMKAVAPLPKCVGFAHRLVARDGHLVVFQGPSLSAADLDEAQQVAEGVGLTTWDTFEYDLPCGPETLERSLIVYRRLG